MKTIHTYFIGIKGIYCKHCVSTITNALLQMQGIEAVELHGDVAKVTGSALPRKQELVQVIRTLGYETEEAAISEHRREAVQYTGLYECLLILAGILLIAYLLRRFLGYDLFTVIPTIDSSVTYGMLFLTGLLTSVHCVGMCGAISLSVTSSGKAEKSLQQPILYNLGRILSYTVIGGMVGALGSVFRINDSLSGVVILAAAIFMFLLALRMLGIFSWQLRRRDAASGKLFFRGRAARIKGRSLRVLSIGLLNGLMPCGPLQAMQIYALSTGSAWRGALVMFLFALGTVPLMLFVGALSSFLHGKGRFMVNKLSAALVLVLAVGMAGRGLSMLGIHPESLLAHMRHPESNEVSEGYAGYQVATLQDGYQELRFELSFSGYADVLVLAEVPVRMHIHVEEGTLTGCNEEVMSRDFGFAQKLKVGDNLIEFTPVQSGDYTYTCWMNMLRNQIKVVEDASILER